jgi:hypothetical protein
MSNIDPIAFDMRKFLVDAAYKTDGYKNIISSVYDGNVTAQYFLKALAIHVFFNTRNADEDERYREVADSFINLLRPLAQHNFVGSNLERVIETLFDPRRNADINFEEFTKENTDNKDCKRTYDIAVTLGKYFAERDADPKVKNKNLIDLKVFNQLHGRAVETEANAPTEGSWDWLGFGDTSNNAQNSTDKSGDSQSSAGSANTENKQQIAAILEARHQFAAIKTYRPEEVARIATDLFRKLVTLAKPSPDESHYKTAQRLEIPGKISLRTIKEALEGSRNLNPGTLAANDAIEIWMPELVQDKKYRKEVTNYLSGIPLAHVKRPAHDLLHYVTSHDAGIKDFMPLMQYQYRMSNARFCNEVLEIKEDEYGRLIRNECKSPTGILLIKQVADKLGLLGDEDLLILQKLTFRIPLDVTQDTLNHCFNPSANNPYSLDLDAMGRDRAVSLSRFFELLCMARGKYDFEGIAQAIYPDEDAVHSRKILSDSIGNFSPRGGFDVEKEAKIKKKGVQTISAALGQKIAEYAFPEDPALRAQCVEFLSSEKKYHRPGTEVAAAIWKTRRQRGHSSSIRVLNEKSDKAGDVVESNSR